MQFLTRCFLVLLAFCGFHLAKAQENDAQVVSGAPNVFLDCSWGCDFDNFRREVNYINFLRERQTADIYVLVTSQNTGGGEEYVMYFLGQHEFEGQNDTLRVNTEIDDTERQISNKLLALFKQGLLPYLLQTPLAERLSYEVQLPDSPAAESPQEQQTDPWKAWVFSVSGGGNMSGESSNNRLSLRARFSANRVTEKTKWRFSASGNRNVQNFYVFYRDSLGEIIQTDTFTSRIQSFYSSASWVKAINDHWSWGAFANVYNSTFSNIALGNDFRLGLEYNFFPYGESDRRMLTLAYKVGPSYNQYIYTTIFDKLKEVLWRHELEFTIYQNQPWGYVSFGINYRNYLHDFRLNSLSFNPDVSWNIARGLTFSLGSYFSLISDQITIPKASITIPSFLLRERIVETSFSYFTYVNLRYTFGSRYSNVVNPRFEGGGSTTFFFF